MKGQDAAIAPISAVILVSVFVLTGFIIYGYVMNATPHDVSYTNESICVGVCTYGSNYELDNTPVVNDSTLICYNDSGIGTTLVRGATGSVCGDFNIVNNRYINFTNNTAGGVCNYTNVNCSYTYDWATTGQQSFYDNSSDITFGGFILASVIVIVLASIAVIGIILLLRG